MEIEEEIEDSEEANSRAKKRSISSNRFGHHSSSRAKKGSKAKKVTTSRKKASRSSSRAKKAGGSDDSEWEAPNVRAKTKKQKSDVDAIEAIGATKKRISGNKNRMRQTNVFENQKHVCVIFFDCNIQYGCVTCECIGGRQGLSQS